jgi:hypothetical protein
VSPQYHVDFDDLFETVFSSGADDALVDSICENLYGTSCEIYATDKYDAKNNLVYKPSPLDEVWLDAEGREQSKLELQQQHKRNKGKIANWNRWQLRNWLQPLLLRGAVSLVYLIPMER